MAVTPVDLYAFGNRKGPKRPRLGIDVFPDAAGMAGPESLPLPRGPSSYADLSQATLTGPYHLLPKGMKLPEGIEVVEDGMDVEGRSTNPPSHHTIYPAARMP